MADYYISRKMIRRKKGWSYNYYLGYRDKQYLIFTFNEIDLYLDFEEVRDIFDIQVKTFRAINKIKEVYQDARFKIGLDDVLILRVETEFNQLKSDKFKIDNEVTHSQLVNQCIKYGIHNVEKIYKDDDRVLKMLSDIRYA